VEVLAEEPRQVHTDLLHLNQVRFQSVDLDGGLLLRKRGTWDLVPLAN
jgi:hypothetical protein